MGARNVPTAFATAIAGGHANVFPLLEIGWSGGTQYLCGLDYAVLWSGNTYQPALGLMAIESVRETGDSYEGIRVVIGGVSSTALALALAEPMQGRPITLRMAALSATNTLAVDANCWSGQLDAPLISDGRSSAVVTLQAEHRMATWDRPRVKRYTDATLQRDFPGDRGLEFVAGIENQRIVWPSADFFKI